MFEYLKRCKVEVIRSHWGPAATVLYRGRGDGYDRSKVSKVITIVRDPVDRFISERVFRPNKRLPDYTKSEDHMGLLMCEFGAYVYRVPFKPPFMAVDMLGIVHFESLLDAIEPMMEWLGLKYTKEFPHKLKSNRPGRAPTGGEKEKWLTPELIEQMYSTKFAKHFGYCNRT